MNREDQFDKHLKNRLDSYSSSVRDGLWDGVLSRQAKRKKRILFLQMVGAGIFILLSGVAFYYFSSVSSADWQPEEKQELTPQAFSETSSGTSTALAQGADSSSSILEGKPTGVPADKLIVSGVHPETNALSQVGMPSGFDSGVQAAFATEPMLNEPERAVESANDLDFSGAADHALTRVSVPEEIRNKSNRARFQINRMRKLPLFSERSKRSLAGLRPALCPSFQYRPGMQWRLELVGGLMVAEKTMEERESWASSYLAARQASESRSYVWETGLRASILSGNGMVFQTGLLMQQIVENFEYHKAEDQHMKIINIYDENGQLVGTDTTYQTIYRQIAGRNRYTYYDVPFSIGYEVENKRWLFGLNATVYLNIRQRNKGFMLAPPDEPKTTEFAVATNYPAFKEQIGISFGASALLGYRVNSMTEFIVEPKVRVITESITRQGYPLNQRYTLYGLSAGVRVRV